MIDKGNKDYSSKSSFLPADYIAKRTEARANFICLTLFVIMMIGLGGAFFVTNRDSAAYLEEQRAISKAYTEQAEKIEEFKKLEAQKAALFEKAEITAALKERVPRSVMLAELVTRMPEDLTLLNLSLDSKQIAAPKRASSSSSSRSSSLVKRAKGRSKGTEPEKPKVQAPKYEQTLKIEGVGLVNNDITDYLTSLKRSPLLEQVELTYIKEAKMKDHELRKFEITARIRSNADASAVVPDTAIAQGSNVELDDKPGVEPDIEGDEDGSVTSVPEETGSW